MINADQAREMVNQQEIEFPKDWKAQIETVIDEQIKTSAKNRKKVTTVQGKVYTKSLGGYPTGTFFLNADQFNEVSATLKQNGFGINEDFRIRFDGQPLTIDILW